MYIVTTRHANGYDIMDTSDMTVETISKDDTLSLLNKGVKIWGVSSFSIENNIDLKVIIRLTGQDSTDVRDYDGYMFNDYDSELSAYYNQILDLYAVEELLDYDIFKLVCEIIRDLNYSKDYKNILSSVTNTEYSVYACNNKYLTLKDSKGDLYKCDYFVCLYCYLEENKAISGVDFIDLNMLKVGKFTLTAEDVLRDYWENSKNRVIGTSKKSRTEHSTLLTGENGLVTVDDINCSYNDLDTYFGSSSRVILSDSYIPLYNMKKVIKHSNMSPLELPWFIEYGKVANVDSNGVTFEDGRYLDDWDLIFSVANVLDFVDSTVCDEFNKYLNSKLAKAKLIDITGNNEFNRLMALKRLGRKYMDDEHYYLSPMSTGFNLDSGLDTQSLRLENIGNIEIKPNHTRVNGGSRRYITVSNYTNLPCCYYSLIDYKVTMGTFKAVSHHGLLGINKHLDDLYMVSVKDGITYYNDFIVPLCVHAIHFTNEGLDIRIGCLVLCEHEQFKFRSAGFISMPLLYFGGKIIDYGSFIQVKTVLHTLNMDKKACESLIGEADNYELNHSLYSECMNLKQNRELKRHIDEDIASVFKSVIKGL